MTSEIRSAARGGAALLLTMAAVCAQAPGPGTVEGYVTDAVSGKPLAGARIKLSSQRDGDQHFTVAGPQGHFQFAGIDLAAHLLTAQYPGYLTYGPTGWLTPSAANAPVQIQVRLEAYSVVSGRVTDATGAPVERVRIDLLVRKPMGVTRAPMGMSKGTIGNDELRSGASTSFTNDRGEYRIPRVVPGTYYLMAESATLGGDKAYRNTYYPGEHFASKARPVVIDRAGEVPNLDFQLARRVGVRVSGRLTMASTGEPASPGAGVYIWPDGAPLSAFWSAAKPDFSIDDLLPGSYVVEAAIRDVSMSMTNQIIPFAARRKIEVGERDIEAVDIALQPTAQIPGTLKFAAGCPEVPLTLEDWVDSRVTVGTNNHIPLPGAGSFVLRSLVPGTHRLNVGVQVPGTQYAIGSARMAGVEVWDHFEMPGAAGPLDITVICSGNGARK